MIREFIARLRTRAKERTEAFLEKLGSAIADIMPSSPARVVKVRILVPTESGDARKTGKLYRLTSDHAPVFSLFTFFTNRQ